MVAGIAYVFTPLTASGGLGDPAGFDANLRYVAPVLIVGFLLLPLIPWFRHGNRPWILIALFSVLLIQGTVTQANWEFEHHLASVALAFLIVGVPALLVAGARRRVPVVALAVFGLVMAITAVALGRVRENYYLDHRYVTASRPPLEGGFRSTPEWQPLQDWGRKQSDERIGVVGRASAFGQYFFYGTDLSNHVQYVGQELRRGTFRPIVNCAAWRRAVNEGDYDYIVTTPKIGALEMSAPPEAHWTETRQEREDRDPDRPRRRLQDHRAARSGDLREAGGGGAHMSFGDYLAGSIELIAVAAAIGFAAVGLRGRLLPGWSGASARLAEVVLGLSLLVVILELVGVVGLYRPGWVLLATLARRCRDRDGASRPPGQGLPLPSPADRPIRPRRSRWPRPSWSIAHWAMPTQTGLDIGMYLPNTTWHNAPFAARFVQDHQVGALHFTEVLNLTVWFYPQNSELLHSAGILFLGNDFLSPLLNIGWMALCLLAAWAFARRLRRRADRGGRDGAGARRQHAAALPAGRRQERHVGLFFFLASAAILVNADAQSRAAAGSARTLHSGGPPLEARLANGALIVAGLAAGRGAGDQAQSPRPLRAADPRRDRGQRRLPLAGHLDLGR